MPFLDFLPSRPCVLRCHFPRSPSLGPSSESNSITLRHTPRPAQSSESPLLELVCLTQSHSITRILNWICSDYGSGGCGVQVPPGAPRSLFSVTSLPTRVRTEYAAHGAYYCMAWSSEG